MLLYVFVLYVTVRFWYILLYIIALFYVLYIPVYFVLCFIYHCIFCFVCYCNTTKTLLRNMVFVSAIASKWIHLENKAISNQIWNLIIIKVRPRSSSCKWMKGCILPFPKKGELGLAKNYRGITLTSIAAKIYNALLRNRIEPKIDNILRKKPKWLPKK